MKPYVMIIDDEPGICTSLNLALRMTTMSFPLTQPSRHSS